MRLSLSVLGLLVAVPLSLEGADKPIDFNRDVRPILSDKCFHCHGPDAHSREAELRLDVEADAKRDRDGSFVINPGKPDASVLIERITSTGEDRMPPPELDKQLTPQEVETLTRWIREGAVFKQAWAYEKPVRHEAPVLQDEKNASWARHWIDSFVLKRLEEEGLFPAPDADRVTLIRRLSFDLTGLPPSVAEVEAFVNDASADAYEKVVDRLLASDECGERLAAYWLDLVRFADTVGYHGDQDHNASLYRDYVIDALISNMPFDQFSREQLAGDYLENQTDDQKIATAYNRLLQTTHEGGLQAKEYLAIYGADRVRNVSNVWFGATVGCAQCHDHKFDPYTAKDFYSLQAFFSDIDEERHFKEGTNTLPAKRAPEIPLLSRREREVLKKLESQQAKVIEQLAALGPSSKELAEKAASETLGGSAVPGETSATAESPEVGAKRAGLEKQLARLEKSIKKIQDSTRSVMVTLHKEPRVTRLLPRGNWMDDSGPETPPAIPEFMGALETGGRRPTRLDLVNWLFDAEHGNGLLTARVFVNRFWYLAFGEGLSRSLEDFGGQGEPPSHPELLDRLSFEFVESGWDVRHMLKLIVLSRTYQQSSRASRELVERDPENRLLARQSRFRIPAEAVRDTALDLSGLLVQKVGGPSVKPYQPAGYYRHLNFPTREYKSDTETAKQWRRGVYVHWQRQFLHPMLKAFDAPTREECTVKRPRSNTPLASLVLLNDPSFVEAARAFAVRIIKQGGSTVDERIAFAFRTATSREPDQVEKKLLADLFADSLRDAKADPEQAEKLLTVGLAKQPKNMDEIEEVAWTTVARAILNLGETYQRN